MVDHILLGLGYLGCLVFPLVGLGLLCAWPEMAREQARQIRKQAAIEAAFAAGQRDRQRAYDALRAWHTEATAALQQREAAAAVARVRADNAASVRRLMERGEWHAQLAVWEAAAGEAVRLRVRTAERTATNHDEEQRDADKETARETPTPR